MPDLASSSAPRRSLFAASKANSVVSAKNRTCHREVAAPKAFIRPTSLRRLNHEVAMEAETPAPRPVARQRNQEHEPLDARKYRAFVLSHLANLLGVEWGIASCNWNAMDCAYGEQYQRSYIARDRLFGSRRGERIFGLGYGR